MPPGVKVTHGTGRASVPPVGTRRAHVLRAGLVTVALALLGSATALFAEEARMDADVLLQRARDEFAHGRFREAAALFAEFSARYASEPAMTGIMPRVSYALGCSYYNIQQMEAAIQAFQEYLRLEPFGTFRAEVLFRVAGAYQFLARYATALATYTNLLREFPGFEQGEDVRFQSAVCLLLDERYNDAVPVLEWLRRHAGDRQIADAAEAYLARCLFLAGEYDHALSNVLELSAAGVPPEHMVLISTIALQLGDHFYDEFRTDTALDAYRCVIRSAEMRQCQAEQLEFDANWLMRMGRCMLDLGMLWEACVAFQEVVQVYPDATVASTAHTQLCFCLAQMHLFERLRREATAFVEHYPDDPQAPAVALLRCESYINQERFADAEAALQQLLTTYHHHPSVDRAEFYLYLAQAMQEKFADARAGFERWHATTAYTNSTVAADAGYWYGMVLYFSDDYSNATAWLTQYLADFPASSYTPDVKYRIASIDYMAERYKRAALGLIEFINAYPMHPMISEAHVLRGDALAAMGMLPSAVKAYRRITPADGPYYHYAASQIGKCYRALEDFTNMVVLYTGYCTNVSDSPAIIEGLYWLGWSYRQLGDLPAAREVYWNALAEHGNKRAWSGFDDILRDLCSLYADTDANARLQVRLREEIAAACARGTLTLASRLHMALQRMLATSATRARVEAENERTRAAYADQRAAALQQQAGLVSDPTEQQARLADARHHAASAQSAREAADRLDQAASSDAADARELARQFMVRYPATALGADGLVFLAVRQLAHGDTNGAMASYAIIKDELPACALCSEAETRLAEHALRTGRLDDAGALLDLAEAHVQDMPTALEIRLLRAHLLRAGGRINDAISLYEDILANRAARGPMWPKALYGLASAYAELGDHRRAIPYYQRIYVMYAGYTRLTAKAYYYSGRCFERVHDMAAAVNSYRALLADERLRECPEAALARERLEHLPVPAAPAAPTKESGV